MNNVKILGDIIVVQPVSTKRKIPSGFAMPEEISENVGKLVAMGQEVSKEFQIGDTIYFGESSRTTAIKGKNYIVMEASNVIGIEIKESSKE